VLLGVALEDAQLAVRLHVGPMDLCQVVHALLAQLTPQLLDGQQLPAHPAVLDEGEPGRLQQALDEGEAKAEPVQDPGP